jgi:plastocyanin
MARLDLARAIAAITLLAGCASDDGAGDINQPSGKTEPANIISILQGAQTRGRGAFTPNPLSISLAASGLVQWSNNDVSGDGYGNQTGVTHNITSDNGAFPPGSVAPGASYQVTFSAPGTYAYHCSIHPTMTGEVTVTP